VHEPRTANRERRTTNDEPRTTNDEPRTDIGEAAIASVADLEQ